VVVACVWRVRALCATPRVTHRRGQMYNGRLRGFGDCGQVEEGVPPKSVADRCKEARNNYSSTIHALVSAVKKLQKPERRWLYRGLSGGQLPRAFRTKGFAEWAFMSTTTSLEVARCVSHDCLRQRQINQPSCGLTDPTLFFCRAYHRWPSLTRASKRASPARCCGLRCVCVRVCVLG
jgi:hypothetical protein